MCNGTKFTIEKISPRAGLELWTARSATGAPDTIEPYYDNNLCNATVDI